MRRLGIGHMTPASDKPHPLSRHRQAFVVFFLSLFIFLTLGCVSVVYWMIGKGGGGATQLRVLIGRFFFAKHLFDFQHLDLPCCLPAVVVVYSAPPK